MSGAAIGIDLGTTFCCASFYREGKGAQVISNEYGERLIPSVVYYDPKTGGILVGKNAIDEIPDCLSNGLYDAKRIIGRKFNDEYISKFKNNNEIPFSIVETPISGQAAFQVNIGGREVIKAPEEVSAEILKYIKKISTEFLGKEVTEAVISVPAYFSNAQRNSTKKAANLAGLKVLKLVTEPTAAAIHYISDKERDNTNILVFDFGGGTLDVSIIRVRNKQFTVKAVYGDTFLGGRDIDEVLFNYFCSKFPPNPKLTNLRKRMYYRRLKNGCVELKKKLSAVDDAKYLISSCYGEEEELRLSLSRAKFENLASHLFQRALDIVELALYDLGMPKKAIQEVVLVGGTTKIPHVREMLRSYFSDSEIKTDIHPDEAVAIGASIQASLLKDGLAELENYKANDITPLSLGCDVSDGLMSTFISKFTSLPCKITETVCLSCNDQTSMLIRIFEGERKQTKYNNLLGELRISGLPKKRAGDVDVHVTFELNSDGILNVTANETSTGISKSLSVTMGQFRLSEKKVKRSIAEAKKNKHIDDTFEKFILYRSKVEKVCKHILYDLNKISSDRDKNFTKEACDNFLTFTRSLEFTEIERLEGRFAVFKNSLEEILKQNRMLGIKFNVSSVYS